MRITVPDYYEAFQCLGGQCPHTCCEKWEVVIDDATAARYAAETGTLGKRLRDTLRRDEDGDWCFPLRGGRCPFLDGENLCEIHRTLGQDATSVTCQEHPRFVEDYGAFREVTLSASCPAANALLLGSEAPLTFHVLETAEPEEDGDEWLEVLLPLRAALLETLADRSVPLRQRLRSFLTQAAQAQPRLDGGETPDETLEPLFPAALELLASLEVLDEDWPSLLRQAELAEIVSQPPQLLERIAVYFAFRYLLKAVNDGDLLGRAELCVFAVLVLERLAAVCGLPEALRRFSAEVEHDDDNLDALLDAFRWRFSLGDFLSALD